jgi:hypothetical protein
MQEFFGVIDTKSNMTGWEVRPILVQHTVDKHDRIIIMNNK